MNQKQIIIEAAGFRVVGQAVATITFGNSYLEYYNAREEVLTSTINH